MDTVTTQLTEFAGTETAWAALVPTAAAVAVLAVLTRVPFGFVASMIHTAGVRDGVYRDAKDFWAGACDMLRGRTDRGLVARLALAVVAVVLIPIRLGMQFLLLGAWVGVPVAFIVWQLATQPFAAVLPVWLWLTGEAGWAVWRRLQRAG